MSDYVFLDGNDYESSNKEYVSIDTDKGKLISIALAASGIILSLKLALFALRIALRARVV